MIWLNRLLFFIVLFLLLSFESILTVPIFSLFLFFKYLDRFSWKDDNFLWIFVALLLAAFSISLFYQLALSWALIFIFIYYLLRSFFGGRLFGRSRQQWELMQLTLFACLQLSIFALSGLKLNFFYFFELTLVLIFLFKKSSSIGRL